MRLIASFSSPAFSNDSTVAPVNAAMPDLDSSHHDAGDHGDQHGEREPVLRLERLKGRYRRAIGAPMRREQLPAAEHDVGRRTSPPVRQQVVV